MVKLKTSLTLDGASTIMDSALAHSRAENLLPLTVVVVAGGKMDAAKAKMGQVSCGLVLAAARRGACLVRAYPVA